MKSLALSQSVQPLYKAMPLLFKLFSAFFFTEYAFAAF